MFTHWKHFAWTIAALAAFGFAAVPAVEQFWPSTAIGWFSFVAVLLALPTAVVALFRLLFSPATHRIDDVEQEFCDKHNHLESQVALLGGTVKALEIALTESQVDRRAMHRDIDRHEADIKDMWAWPHNERRRER